MGYFDFSGAGPVHICGGIAGFIGTAIMEPRKGLYSAIRPDLSSEKQQTHPEGYKKVADMVTDGKWSMMRVHQFVRDYTVK